MSGGGDKIEASVSATVVIRVQTTLDFQLLLKVGCREAKKHSSKAIGNIYQMTTMTNFYVR